MSKTLTSPALNDGEIYIGAIVSADSSISHHIILLPGEAPEVDFAAAKTWAASVGGELPSRIEQSMLYALARGQFKRDWYWSGEQHAAGSDSAWCQGFGLGYQDDTSTTNELRARAVRRVAI